MNLTFNAILFLFWMTTIPFLQAQQNLVINELMADNETILMDITDNNYDDWIELYNKSSDHINLKNYYLTDDPSLPAQWAFPDTTITPGSFLIIWTDNDEGAKGLHTNFKLSKSGEFIGLYSLSDETTTAIDSFSFGSQSADISFGRYPDGDASWQTFSTPTPGEPNSTVQNADSTDFIFDDTIVHNYQLHFYTANWADSLTYNYDHGEEYMPAQLTYDGFVLDSIGVRYKGNSTYHSVGNSPKKPFKFKFDKYHKNRTFFGVKFLNFSNCFKDPSFMREKIGYDIISKYVPAPRAAYANIYVDEHLIGLYVQVEQIDEIFLARHFQNNSGNLYKASGKGTGLEYLGDDPARYQSGLELKTNEDANDWSDLITMLDELNNSSPDVFIETMENELNLDLCCRMFAFMMTLSNFDSYTGSGRNFYLYHDAFSGQFQMMPWDFNETFGSYTNNWDIFRVNIVNVPNLPDRPLSHRIVENESLRQDYLTYIDDMMTGPASIDSVSAMTGRLKLLISESVQADSNNLYTYEDFLTNIDHDVVINKGAPIPGLKPFIKRRYDNLKIQLDQYMQSTVTRSETKSFQLQQNYPNPFNPNTTITFSLTVECDVQLDIFNIRGETVATLVADRLSAGQHHYQWRADNMAAGIYFCRLETGSENNKIKMLLLK